MSRPIGLSESAVLSRVLAATARLPDEASRLCLHAREPIEAMGGGMNLWCSICHTKWIEEVLHEYQSCPFKDCEGKLTSVNPAHLNPKPKEPKAKPTYPLVENLK